METNTPTDNRSMEANLKDADNKIKELVKELGAKSHKFDINYTVLFGVPFPKVFSIVIEYENGRNYGQSDNNFRDCFDKLVRFISKYERIGSVIVPEIKTLRWNKYPENKPKDYGTYLVYRKGCNKKHFETWNNTGWAYNNNDITHWAEIENPED